MKVQDLIDFLEDADPDDEVRLAMQPSWPFEYSIGQVEIVESDEDDSAIVYLAEGSQLNYLPGTVKEFLGW